MTRRLFAALSILLSACTGAGQDMRGYPSLAKRPVESPGGPPSVPAPPPASPVADADLARRLAELSDQATRGGAAFDNLYDQVASAVRGAASSAVDSEAWVAAQVSLGRLEQARHDSVFALASLDALYADRMRAQADGTPGAGVAEIEAARTPVLAMVDSQNDRFDGLKAALREP